MYRYEVFEMRTVFASRKSYGIVCKEKRNGGWVPVAVAAPFSGDREAVSRLAGTCTARRLPPERLPEAVADFMEGR